MTGRDDGTVPDDVQLLAHDIRAAVSDVIGGVRLINRDGLSQDARLQLDRVQASSELLARLVEELLGGTQREQLGQPGNLNLRRFLDDEVRRWHGAAQENGIRITLDRAANLPEVVQIDQLHLRRIMSNLMGNAVRHSGGQRIVLGAELCETGEALCLRVSDDGAGISSDILSILAQGTSGPRLPQGERNGMGLNIALAHAEAMGGMVSAENVDSGGARVMLILPRKSWQGIAPVDDALPDLRGLRVLVVDDSATNRTLITSMLTRLGAEYETARDGIEGLNWLARERFDLALIDIEMPILGGLDVLRSERLRQARGVAPPTSLVAMTAYVLGDNRDAIVEAGADAILAKPLGSIQVFGKAIRGFLRAAPDVANWAPDFAPALSAATLSDLMDAAGSDGRGDLLLRLREDLAQVDRQLILALQQGDTATIETQTHILLSLSSAVGALPTQVAARRLVVAARQKSPDAMKAAGDICLERLAQLRGELDQAST